MSAVFLAPNLSWCGGQNFLLLSCFFRENKFPHANEDTEEDNQIYMNWASSGRCGNKCPLPRRPDYLKHKFVLIFLTSLFALIILNTAVSSSLSKGLWAFRYKHCLSLSRCCIFMKIMWRSKGKPFIIWRLSSLTAPTDYDLQLFDFLKMDWLNLKRLDSVHNFCHVKLPNWSKYILSSLMGIWTTTASQIINYCLYY